MAEVHCNFTALNVFLLMSKESEFSKQIQSMFNAIAPKYDFLNHFLSLNQDRYWRKKAVRFLDPVSGKRVLDIATGTGDVALEIVEQNPNQVKVFGIDFCHNMLKIGKNKIDKKNLNQSVSFQFGAAEALPFLDKSFYGVITAFGVRNFSNREKGLAEMWRVLAEKGRVVILEFSFPEFPVLSWVYRNYFDTILPRIGRFFSGHTSAYSYLPSSVSDFPSPGDFVRSMNLVGFSNIRIKPLTFGIATIYYGEKNV